MNLRPTFQKKLPFGYFTVFSQKPNFELRELNQVHGNVILGIEDINPMSEADGLYMKKEKTDILAIKTADCLPICVIGHNGVAMLHAGWRGVRQKIMTRDEVSKIDPFYFFIGPSIQKESFKVTEEFSDNFPKDPEFFSRATFDLQAVTKKIIYNQFPKATIEDCGIDTFLAPQFHSFRRDKTKERNWNLFSQSAILVGKPKD